MPVSASPEYFDLINSLYRSKLPNIANHYPDYFSLTVSDKVILTDDGENNIIRQLIINTKAVYKKRSRVIQRIISAMRAANIFDFLHDQNYGSYFRSLASELAMHQAHSNKEIFADKKSLVVPNDNDIKLLQDALEYGIKAVLDCDISVINTEALLLILANNKFLSKRVFNSSITLGRYYLTRDDKLAVRYFMVAKAAASAVNLILPIETRLFLNVYLKFKNIESCENKFNSKNRFYELLNFRLALKSASDLNSHDAKKLLDLISTDTSTPAIALGTKYLISRAITKPIMEEKDQNFVYGLRALYGINYKQDYDDAILHFEAFIKQPCVKTKSEIFNVYILSAIAIYQKLWLVDKCKPQSIDYDDCSAAEISNIIYEQEALANSKSKLIKQAMEVFEYMLIYHHLDLSLALHIETFLLLADFVKVTKKRDDQVLILNQFISFYKNTLTFFIGADKDQIQFLTELTDNILNIIHDCGLLTRSSHWQFAIDLLMEKIEKATKIADREVNFQVLADFAKFSSKKIENIEMAVLIHRTIDAVLSEKIDSLDITELRFALSNIEELDSLKIVDHSFDKVKQCELYSNAITTLPTRSLLPVSYGKNMHTLHGKIQIQPTDPLTYDKRETNHITLK